MKALKDSEKPLGVDFDESVIEVLWNNYEKLVVEKSKRSWNDFCKQMNEAREARENPKWEKALKNLLVKIY